MLLFAVEKVFLAMRKGNVIQNKFFALLVDYEILRSSEGKAGNEVLVVGDELEQSRDLIDLKDRLEESSSFFRSYLAVQVLFCQCNSHSTDTPSFRSLRLSSVLDAVGSWPGNSQLRQMVLAYLSRTCIATSTGKCTNAAVIPLRSTVP